MASQKIDKISEPDVKISNLDEFKEALHQLTMLMRRVDRFDATLERRTSAAGRKHEISTKPVFAELNPLLDRVFWYAFMHWNDLTTGKATESVKLHDAEFKRHIDTIGTLVIDKQVVARYLRDIDTSDFAMKLRQTLGEEKAGNLLKQLKGFVTYKLVPEVNTDDLKDFLKSPEAVSIEGAEVHYTNRLTLIPAQSPASKPRKKPTTAVRQIP